MRKTARIGDVGDRVVISGTVISATRVCTQWGNSTLFKINGAQGELAAWMSSHDVSYDYDEGDPITVRCTVKKYKQVDGDLWVIVTNGTIDEQALAIV